MNPKAGATEPLHEGPYRLRLERQAASPYVQYPANVYIETFSRCPACCSFCPYPDLERIGTKMSDALLDKVLSGLEEIPSDIPFEVNPFGLNEPMLDMRLAGIIERLETRVPNASIKVVTTGIALTRERLAELTPRRNISGIWFSLNENDPQRYRQLMGIDFERTVGHLDHLHREFTAGHVPFEVIITRVGTDDARDADFRTWVSRRWPRFTPRVLDRHDWLGKRPRIHRALDDEACGQWFEMWVTSTGEVAQCCQDSHTEWPLGNVNTQTLLEIYNSPHLRARREQLTPRARFTPCKGCSFCH